MTRMVRRHVRRSKTKRITSRHGKNTHSKNGRGSTLKVKTSRGKVTGVWGMIPFPRAVARFLGAHWADPRGRGRR